MFGFRLAFLISLKIITMVRLNVILVTVRTGSNDMIHFNDGVLDSEKGALKLEVPPLS